MDVLQRTRRLHRRSVDRAVTRLENELAKEARDMVELKVGLVALQTASEQFAQADQDILNALVKDDHSTPEDEDKAALEAEEAAVLVHRLRERVQMALTPPPPPPQPQSSTTPALSTSAYKLPKITLPRFDGELKEWVPFWASFKKIHEDSRLTPVDKFHYLRQAMMEKTEAAEIVSSYPQSASNYPEAVAALERRFGNPEILLQVYVREILKLVLSNVGARERLPLATLLVKLEANLRSLKTLNLATVDPATWLYPLVESALPEHVLVAFQRDIRSQQTTVVPTPPATAPGAAPAKTMLDKLMEFLEAEVQLQQKLDLAQTGFGIQASRDSQPGVSQGRREGFGRNGTRKGESGHQSKGKNEKSSLPVADFQNLTGAICDFCEKQHDSKDCFRATQMSLAEKKKLLQRKNRCFHCFRSGHAQGSCKMKFKCWRCFRNHQSAMCPELKGKSEKEVKPAETVEPPEVSLTQVATKTNSTGKVCSSNVLLQTVMADLHGNGTTKRVRCFLDSGSQYSYILSSVAQQMGLPPVGAERAVHSLFGGANTECVEHHCYQVELQAPGKGSKIKILVRDQPVICARIPKISAKLPGLLKELKNRKIFVSDVGPGSDRIDVLLGSDVWGRLQTGRVVQLMNGLTASQTKLGWTVSGLVTSTCDTEPTELTVLSLLTRDSDVTKLWDLEMMGIIDPVESLKKAQHELLVKAEFLRNITQLPDGRYEVGLPWKHKGPPLADNKETALKRLIGVRSRLEKNGTALRYLDVFKDWEKEGFIERVNPGKAEGLVHYIPHRPVFKESPTTPIRPVFDASCRTNKGPSLNDCLETGTSYLVMIPDLLLRFREHQVGFSSDIRKAFQMVSVRSLDRDCLRFLLWSADNPAEFVEYRHARVLFGATCSPFILNATVEHHLKHVPDQEQEVAEKIWESMYVDNCVGSVCSEAEYVTFREKAIEIFRRMGMELRLWVSNIDRPMDSPSTSVLGLIWDRRQDDLAVKMPPMQFSVPVTKRSVLATVAKIFDPLGMVCPALLPIKILLQNEWKLRHSWDEEIENDTSTNFLQWFDDLPLLSEVKIPRRSCALAGFPLTHSLHIFADASERAYGAVIFLREETPNGVSVQFLIAKSRVAPVKVVSMPRLELLACLVAVRLASVVKRAMKVNDCTFWFWSDSTTALSWITTTEHWAVFVRNRVSEIQKNSKPSEWHRIPGRLNPADIYSRGCSIPEFVKLAPWKGPTFLYSPQEEWPLEQIQMTSDALAEKIKSHIVSFNGCLLEPRKDYSIAQLSRIFAWVRRFVTNVQCPKNLRPQGALTDDEKERGKNLVYWVIQRDAREQLVKPGVPVFRGEEGLLRVQTRLGFRKDLEAFKYPVLLPSHHPWVEKLVWESHLELCHAGLGIILSKLRETVWIIHARRTVKTILRRCVRCRRLTAQPVTLEPPPLPENRVRDAVAFEVTGVDLAGPLVLKSGGKRWITLYTCAIFRAVRLDLVSSLSTKAFLESFKRFVRRQGCPKLVYSDNGTNFVGAQKKLQALNIEPWSRLQWKFSPPSSPWYGGFWERLIRSVKDLLRRVIRDCTFSKDQLEWVLISIEDIVNSRPLTYVSENPDELEPLTPNHFLKPLCQVPVTTEWEDSGDTMRHMHRMATELLQQFRERFRKEYLSQLINRVPGKNARNDLRVGDMVVVFAENRKRHEWPLGRILELFEGRDGVKRVARVLTKNGELVRAVQRLYPLELAHTVLDTNLRASYVQAGNITEGLGVKPI